MFYPNEDMKSQYVTTHESEFEDPIKKIIFIVERCVPQ